MRRFTTVLLLLVGVASADRLDEIDKSIQASQLTGQSYDLSGTTIEIGPVQMEVKTGSLFPVSPLDGTPREFVFLGEANLKVTAPDAIEAGQLEFHTGDAGIQETVNAATMVICRDLAVQALLDGRSPVAPAPAALEQASEKYRAWHSGTERKVLGVDEALTLDVLQEPDMDTFFAGRFSGRNLGAFLVSIRPDESEQVTVGQFVQEDFSRAEEKRARRWIRRQQRRDRFRGLEIDDLGDHDSWMQSAHVDGQGRSTPGRSAFSGTHYQLDVEVSWKGEKISGIATVDVSTVRPGHRAVVLSATPDVVITSVTDQQEQTIPFLQRGGRTIALLPAAATTESFLLKIGFEGAMIEKLEGTSYRLRSTTSWYPHVDDDGRATYDATFRWPQQYDLIAAGVKVEGEQRGDTYWERRKFDVPVDFYTFEIGRYDFQEETIGDTKVRFAFERKTSTPGHFNPAIVKTVRSALEHYEEIFGPYPLPEMTVVTCPRDFGQGLLSFVTIPSSLVEPWWRFYVRFGLTDFRMLIAHELAHQWWGNILGWKSYRDQWLSESMATYSARRWALQSPETAHLPRQSRKVSRVDATVLAGTRDIYEIGPVVLGHRLASSKADAVQPIMYYKGSAVLGMLEQFLGEEAFIDTQKAIMGIANFREISTETYFAAIERMTGADLSWFVQQYVYGTEIPRVVYDYAIDEKDDSWQVTINARAVPSYRFDYHIEELEDGTLDVRRRVISQPFAKDGAIGVPFQVPVMRDDVEEKLKKKENMIRIGDRHYNAIVDGRLLLSGEVSSVTIDVEHEPLGLWLDPNRIVLGYFLHERQSTERLRVQDALSAEAEGNLEDALAALRRESDAVERPAEDEEGDDDEIGFEERVRLERLAQRSQIGINLYLARLLTDQGEFPSAEAALQRVLDSPAAGSRFRGRWERPGLRRSGILAGPAWPWNRAAPSPCDLCNMLLGDNRRIADFLLIKAALYGVQIQR